MTIYVADIASYQKGLTPSALLAAGFTGVNVKVSHGMGQKSVAPDAHDWLADKRFTHSTFHYLTGEASGAAQAGYAYMRMVEMGGPLGWAHVVDCESDATQAIYLEYVDTMALLLKRPIATYTGDWYWVPRGWPRPVLSPWLWASPNSGYLSAYPGDSSSHWSAGYGGWGELAAMQYAVMPVAGVAVSQTAIRSAEIWAQMRGVSVAVNSLPASTSLKAEVDVVGPNRRKDQDGTIGDTSHQQNVSDHNPDETGNTGGVEDPDSINEVHARDIDSRGPWLPSWSMARITSIVVGRARAGLEPRLRYWIFDGWIYRRSTGFAKEAYTGDDPHDTHAHASFMYGSGSGTSNPENITAPWGIVAAYKEENDVTEAELIAALNKWAASAIVKAPKDGDPNRTVLQALRDARLAYEWVWTQVSPAVAGVKAQLDGLTVQVDIPSLAEALAEALPPVTGAITPADVENALIRVLRSGVDGASTP